MMNDYIDYYTYMNNLNQMPGMDQVYTDEQIMYNNIPMPTAINNAVSNNQTKSTAEPYKGFTQGNMFDSLYEGYRNYKPQELNPANEKEYALLLVQMYGFAAHDLGLYLDVNPNDVNVINQRAEYMNMYKEALENYEKNYGPITETSDELYKSPWAWNTKKWPWEGNN